MSDQEDHDGEIERDPRGRFTQGNRGGPGRPKGSRGPSIKAALDRAIEESVREEDGRSILDALARTAIKAAADGDFRFWKEIIDRFDGPIRQEIDQDQTIRIERVARPNPSLEDDPDL